MKPVCVKCGLFFTIVKNGVVLEEGMPLGDKTWEPYKMYLGDHWRCRGCGAELALGAITPFCEHYMPNYEQQKYLHPPIVFIKDC